MKKLIDLSDKLLETIFELRDSHCRDETMAVLAEAYELLIDQIKDEEDKE